jgi:hypothetical protein
MEPSVAGIGVGNGSIGWPNAGEARNRTAVTSLAIDMMTAV